jgi:glycosyltransferase involved in cell wall biosynthesis
MEYIFEIVNGILISIITGILASWFYLLVYMLKSFRQSPKLQRYNMSVSHKTPKISVILPARNEEKYIAKCLDSILKQDYINFEIIAVNDSSTDRTGDIIMQFTRKSPKIVAVSAGPAPLGWVGKNWACFQGYLNATGDMFLFTDADTIHSPYTMSLAVGHLIEEDLDAITAIPRLLCLDFWTKITLPMLSIFLHTQFSALRVNNPKSKTGYFFGSFFVITRGIYEKIGTHKAVKHEFIEDGALGKKVKEEKFRMKMVRGEHYIDAIWARNLNTLWHGLRRLIIPLYSQNKNKTFLMSVAVFFLLFVPFLLIPYSLVSFTINTSTDLLVERILLYIVIATDILILLTNAIQARLALFQNPIYALGSPASGAIISLSFISSIIDAKKIGAINWRNRQYTVEENQNPL